MANLRPFQAKILCAPSGAAWCVRPGRSWSRLPWPAAAWGRTVPWRGVYTTQFPAPVWLPF